MPPAAKSRIIVYMTRALVLLVLLALPSGALAQARDARREQLMELRDHHDHETVSTGVQLRLGHAVGDALNADPPANTAPFGSPSRPTAPIGGAVEVAGLVDFRYSPRSHWHMRIALFAALTSDRTNFGMRLHPWRVGVRWFPLAVGFGSDLVTLRIGADLGLTWTEKWDLDFLRPMPTRSYRGANAMVHFAPNLEVGFEVSEGWEVNLWGMYVFVAGDAQGVPLMHGEYGVSVAALFW